MRKILFVFIALVLLTGCAKTATEAPAVVTEETAAEIAGMIYIPSGEFQMGCDPEHNAGFSCVADVLPLHPVNLDGYYIDQFEVTTEQYSECVAAGACEAPSNPFSETQESYYGNAEFADFPVVYVRWQDANNYCTWAGKRLPTEAEWEKAARGTTPTTYAWGDEELSCSLGNVYDNSTAGACVGDTSKVGSYPEGASVYGVMDMTGNVWEWVNDWYTETYYKDSPSDNPGGPEGDTNRVLRGGSWAAQPVVQLVASRSFDPYFNSSSDVGFRCAATPGGK